MRPGAIGAFRFLNSSPVTTMTALPLPTTSGVIATIIAASGLFATLGAAQLPVITITPRGATARESGFSIVSGPEGAFHVRRNILSAVPLVVNYVASGSATSGADYVALPGTITLNPSGAALVTTLPLDVSNDNLTERDETVTVTLLPGANYQLGSASSRTATVTIIDVDQRVQLTAVDTLAEEASQNNGSIKLERFGTLSNNLSLTVKMSGTATNGADYNTIPATVVIPQGDSIIFVSVVPKPDNVAEGNETAHLSISGGLVLPFLGVRVTIVDAAVTVRPSIATITEVQGNTANFVFTRTGNISGSVTIPFTVSGTAANGTDYNTIASSVTIGANAPTASVPVVVKGDASQEGAETIVVTLQPVTNLGLGSPNAATMVIDDLVLPTVATVSLNPSSVIGGTGVNGTITLNGPAQAGGVAVTLSSNSPAATPQAATLTVPAGQSSLPFTLTTNPVATNTTATISAVAPTGSPITQTLAIQAAVLATTTLNRATVTPQAASDVGSVSGTVTLTGKAPSVGTQILLTSSNAAAASVPASVTVPANQTSATFVVTVVPVVSSASATITATRGAITNTQNLTVQPPSVTSFTFNPASLAGQSNNSGTSAGSFALDGPVPSAGLTLTSSSNSPIVTVTNPSLFLPAGVTTGIVNVRASPVDVTTPVTVTATLASSNRAGTVTVVPPTPVSVSLTSSTVVGGGSVSATVTLNGNAPANGLTLPVASNSPVAFPCANGPITSISFTPNFTSRNFSVCTQAVASATSATITVGSGATAVSAPLQIVSSAVAASSVVLSTPEVVGGTGLNGTVTLTGPAPGNGSTVTITSNTSGVNFRLSTSAPLSSSLQVPIAAGQSSAGFQIRTSIVPTDVVVTVTANPGAASQTFTVRAPVLTALTLTPASVQGGTSVSGSVGISGSAPTGGMPVQLASSNASVGLPSVVTILANAQGAWRFSGRWP